jgi:hypothetical protein
MYYMLYRFSDLQLISWSFESLALFTITPTINPIQIYDEAIIGRRFWKLGSHVPRGTMVVTDVEKEYDWTF